MKFLVLLFLIGFATANIHQGQEEEERNLADIWEKVKTFFSNLEIDIKKKYTRFGEWVTNTFKEGLDKGASEIENIKKIAKEFLESAENVSKEVVDEAKEFFSKHKEDLGDIWDEIKNTGHEITKPHKTNPPTTKPHKTNQPTTKPRKTNQPTTKPHKTNQPTTKPHKTNQPTTESHKTNQPTKHPVSRRTGRKHNRQANKKKH